MGMQLVTIICVSILMGYLHLGQQRAHTRVFSMLILFLSLPILEFLEFPAKILAESMELWHLLIMVLLLMIAGFAPLLLLTGGLYLDSTTQITIFPLQRKAFCTLKSQ